VANPSLDFRAIARKLSLVENESEGYKSILQALDFSNSPPVVGITGPPAAGKSTLINALLLGIVSSGKKIAVLAVDPSSPFNYGALLGDRIRMASFYNSPQVFIRSIATRGSLGGISDKIIEMTDVLRAEGFDYIFVETVGVGQSEVEIAGLADTTVLVLGPSSGDEIQAMKAGIMEIADIYVVNKMDRQGAEAFVSRLERLLMDRFKTKSWQAPIVRTEALNNQGTSELIQAIEAHSESNKDLSKKATLLAEKAFKLIQKKRMKDFSKAELVEEIHSGLKTADFNIYTYIAHK